MITNYKINKPMLQTLAESKYEFVLTGSRYFGYAGTDSDWDLFIENSTEVERYLAALGFKREKMTTETVDYSDMNCAFVMKHPAWNIHIQVVHDASLKYAAQEFLKHFPFRLLNKEMRKSVWNWAMNQSRKSVGV